MAGVSYAVPWLVNLLHRLPHFSLCWEPTSSQFRPKDPDCQRALLLLGAAALACLTLNLLFLLLYSFWLRCRRRGNEEHLDTDCCCTAWCVVIATLVCRAGIASSWVSVATGDQRRHPLGHLLAPPRQPHGGGGAGPHVGHRGCPEPHGGAAMP